MSSHHIVREKQEPALLVLGLHHFDPEWLGQLLEWSPTVIAAAAVAEQLMMYDIHIDWLLTNHAPPANLPATTQIIASHQNGWLPDALQRLIGEGYPAVNIITDSFMAELYLPFIAEIDIVIYHQEQKIYAVKPGFEKWKAAGAKLQIIDPPAGLACKNLDVWDSGVYTVQRDGFIRLNFNSAYVFIAEEL